MVEIVIRLPVDGVLVSVLLPKAITDGADPGVC
jgi:hypothetical protein